MAKKEVRKFTRDRWMLLCARAVVKNTEVIKHPFDYISLNLLLEEVYMISPPTFTLKISKF